MLALRFRSVSMVKLPSEAGIVPSKPFLASLR